MFTLWYSVLSWKEYRDAIWEKLSAPKQPSANNASTTKPKEPALPPKKTEPSRIPVIEPSKSPSPQPPKSPTIQRTPPAPQIPKATSPLPQRPLEPPAKPPRSPSPHPMRSEAFEEIEYEDEDSDVEEDEEDDSVVDSSFPIRSVKNPVNDFISQEVNSQQRSFGLHQR